jgi:hypothetical protein
LVTRSVSPSLRNSRHRFSAGRPVSTPDRFSLKTRSQSPELLELHVEALPDATHSGITYYGHCRSLSPQRW